MSEIETTRRIFLERTDPESEGPHHEETIEIDFQGPAVLSSVKAAIDHAKAELLAFYPPIRAEDDEFYIGAAPRELFEHDRPENDGFRLVYERTGDYMKTLIIPDKYSDGETLDYSVTASEAARISEAYAHSQEVGG